MTLPPSLILNVDDNDGARYAKSRVLLHAGFEVIEAATGQGALDQVRTRRPALVLLDVKLPDINGIEVCSRLKRDPQTRSTLVLQTSAAAVQSLDKVRALDAPKKRCATPTGARTSFSRRWRTNCAIRSRRSAMRSS